MKKVIANASTRRSLKTRLAKTSNTVALPLNLEQSRLDCLACFTNGELPKSVKTGLTWLGHKTASKAAALDVMLIAALTGNYDIAGLLSVVADADNKYGRSDTPDALSLRIRDHLSQKRNGTHYIGSASHLGKNHPCNLTVVQAEAVARFGGLLAVPLRTALKNKKAKAKTKTAKAKK
jgi:hypothetical protein